MPLGVVILKHCIIDDGGVTTLTNIVRVLQPVHISVTALAVACHDCV